MNYFIQPRFSLTHLRGVAERMSDLAQLRLHHQLVVVDPQPVVISVRHLRPPAKGGTRRLELALR
jgi:hypothetical protein